MASTYTIIREGSPEALINEVNTHIEAGWEPVGGVCEAQFAYLQAMIRHKKPPKLPATRLPPSPQLSKALTKLIPKER